MDIQEPSGREGKLRLSMVEKLIVTGGFTLLCSLLGIVYSSFASGQEKLSQAQDKQQEATKQLSKSVDDLRTQQAVGNAQLQALNQQLSNIPQLTSDVATLKVQVDRNSSDIHELQTNRRAIP